MPRILSIIDGVASDNTTISGGYPLIRPTGRGVPVTCGEGSTVATELSRRVDGAVCPPDPPSFSSPLGFFPLGVCLSCAKDNLGHRLLALLVGFVTSGCVVAGAAPERKPSALLPVELLWTATLTAPPAASPVQESGRLFVVLRSGRIAAVNLENGKLDWEASFLTNEESPWVVEGQPAVGGGILYVAGADELSGLDAVTGRVRWSVPLDAPLSAPLVWRDGWLIASLDGGTLVVFRAATGETIWRRELESDIDVAPALAGDQMYVSLRDGGLLALSLLTGNLTWEQQFDGALQEVLPLDDLFVGSTDNYFYRLSRLDGNIKWRWRTGGDVVGRAVVDTQRVYFCSRDNVVWGLDRVSGVQKWKQPLAVRPTGGPVYVEDLLVIGGLSEEIRFLDPTDGMSYGRIPVPSELAYPPLHLTAAVGEPSLVFITGDGELRALGTASAPAMLDPVSALLLVESPVNIEANAAATAALAARIPAWVSDWSELSRAWVACCCTVCGTEREPNNLLQFKIGPSRPQEIDSVGEIETITPPANRNLSSQIPGPE